MKIKETISSKINDAVLSKINEITFLFIHILSALTLFLYGIAIVDKISIVVLFCALCLLCAVNKTVLSRRDIIGAAMVLLSLLVTFILHRGLGIVLSFLNMFLAMFLLKQRFVSHKTMLRTKLVYVSLCFLFLISCNVFSAYTGYVYTIFGHKLNVNMYGILALYTAFHTYHLLEIISLSEKARGIWKIVAAVVFFYFVFISDCRTALVGYLFFVVAIVFKKKPIKAEVFSWILLAVVVLSLVFPYLFVKFYELTDGQDIRILGKSIFTGRQIVWKNAFEDISRHYLFGTGRDFLLQNVHSSVTFSAHNSFIAMLLTMGALPTCAFAWLLVSKGKTNINGQKALQFMLLSCLFVAMFETSLTESYLIIPFVTLFLQYNPEKE